jgi:hypothetical protein
MIAGQVPHVVARELAGVEGLEPPASGFGDRRSSQLSYTPARQAAGKPCRTGNRSRRRRRKGVGEAVSRGSRNRRPPGARWPSQAANFHTTQPKELPELSDRGNWARLIADSAYGLRNGVRTFPPLFSQYWARRTAAYIGAFSRRSR